MKFNMNWAETTADMKPDIAEVMDMVRSRVDEAKADKTRPKYHFASPSHNLIDTWGACFHKGICHVFYDINGDCNPIRYAGYFGHIGSEDLVHWNQYPIAMCPEKEAEELQLNDGCVAFDAEGKPVIWYTRVFEDGRPREHMAVRGDDDMVAWERVRDVPCITMENHGGPVYENGWSDPVIFRECGRIFMIISKCVTAEGRKNEIPIYEATDDTLMHWEYKGTFLDDTGEVLNFTKIGDKWVLIHSPYNNPVWLSGEFDINTLRFIPEKTGTLSFGYINQGIFTDVSRGFYATTVAERDDGERIIFGWISGFDAPVPEKWMGAIGIPRRLSLDEDNNLLMNPANELELLRKDNITVTGKSFETECTSSFELIAEFDSDILIDINGTVIKIDNEECILRDIKVSAEEYGKPEYLRLYVDVTTAELFINNGKCSITRCIPALDENIRIKISSSAELKGEIYNLGL